MIYMYTYTYIYIHTHYIYTCVYNTNQTLTLISAAFHGYGVATISRMLKNIGLFCKRDLQKRPIFCKETYILKHPTHRSHPIALDS